MEQKYINFGCGDASTFIGELYKFLNDKSMCFLSGTFVFDNDNNSLFNSLLYGKDRQICAHIRNRLVGQKSHKTFYNPQKFKTRKNSDESTKDKILLIKPDNDNTHKQFEKTITFGAHLYELCQKECIKRNFTNCETPSSEECIKNNTDFCTSIDQRKGVILFYHFKVNLLETALAVKKLIEPAPCKPLLDRRILFSYIDSFP